MNELKNNIKVEVVWNVGNDQVFKDSFKFLDF